jgi:hypothetical protein
MKKHWIRFIAFWIITTVLFTLLNLAMKSGNEKWSYFYHLPRNSVDVIFIGSSHNFTAFQPTVIDSIIPVNSYVLGIDAENVIVSYYELREVLKTQHPDVVVLETYTMDIDDTEKMGFIYEFTDAGVLDANKLAIATRYLMPEEYYSVFPTLRKRLDWSNLAGYFTALPKQLAFLFSSEIDAKRGAQIRTHAIVDNDPGQETLNPDQEYREPSPDIEVYLLKFYELCKENDIQLVLATSPVLNERMVENEFYAPYDESAFVEKYNIPVITFPEDEFNLLHFYNPTHVNMLGSTIVSIEAAKSLAQIMGLTIDQEMLAFYESYEFSGYSMTNEEGNYLFELIPSNPEAPLEYQWKLFNAQTGQTTFQSEWSRDSSAEFYLGLDEGFTYLVYEIRNPAGDQTVGVSFPLNGNDE